MRRHRGGLTAHDNRAEPRYSRPGAPIHPEQPRGTKGTTTRLTIAGNRKFESTSLQQTVSLSPAAAFDGSRTPLFRAGLGSWLDDRVSRDAPGFPLRANRRQYL